MNDLNQPTEQMLLACAGAMNMLDGMKADSGKARYDRNDAHVLLMNVGWAPVAHGGDAAADLKFAPMAFRAKLADDQFAELVAALRPAPVTVADLIMPGAFKPDGTPVRLPVASLDPLPMRQKSNGSHVDMAALNEELAA